MFTDALNDFSLQFPVSRTPWKREGDPPVTNRMTLWEFIMTIAVAAGMSAEDSVTETSLRELLTKGCGYTNLTQKVIASAKDGLKDMLFDHGMDYPIRVTLLSGKVSDDMKLSDKLVFKVQTERIASRGRRYLAVKLNEFQTLRTLAVNLRFDRLLAMYFYIKSRMSKHSYSSGTRIIEGYGAWIRGRDIRRASGIAENDDKTYWRYRDRLIAGYMIGHESGSIGMDSCFTIEPDPELLEAVIQEHKKDNRERYGSPRGKYEDSYKAKVNGWKRIKRPKKKREQKQKQRTTTPFSF